MQRIHAFVKGIVQGVGFRWATRAKAKELGLHGWVRNTPDGRVELVAEGDPGTLKRLLEWCESGPPGASVDGVEIVSDESAQTSEHTSFEIVR